MCPIFFHSNIHTVVVSQKRIHTNDEQTFFFPNNFPLWIYGIFQRNKVYLQKQSIEIYILTQSSGTHATHTLTTVDETNMNVVCVTHLLISIWQAFVVDILLSYSGLSRAKRSARRFVVKARVDEREKIQADRVCSKVIRLYG